VLVKFRATGVDSVPTASPKAATMKYPQADDVYECQLYPGHSCRVVQVVNAQVTFQWLGDYARLEPQVVPVNRFIVDFRPVETG
jgi:hypothetical protein